MRSPFYRSSPRRLHPAAIAGVVLLAFAILALASSAQAATYTVGTTADLNGVCNNPAAGTCSLRQLIEFENGLQPAPNPFDVIVVPAGSYRLSEGELKIKQSLAIVGAGARTTHLFEPEASVQRVFKIEQPNSDSTPVLISGLEISGGNANEVNGSFGGDVLNTGETILQEDWITEGTAESGGGISNNTGTLVLDRSLVSNNHATKGGGDSGGIQNHGAAGKAADLAVEDSTISDNDARLGAGIFSWSDEPVGNDVSVINSTVAKNSTQEEVGGTGRGLGGGLLITDGTADVLNSIVAYNVATVNAVFNQSNCATTSPGTIVSIGNNLETETDCGFTAPGDLQSEFGIFEFTSGEPQNNGGNTDTIAPEAGGPGVDAISTSSPFCSGVDQRGVTRPQGSGCDIGAVELTPLTIEATEGSQFTAQVAIRPACGIETNLTPRIEWGDGLKSVGTFEENGEQEVTGIRGTHEYVQAGTYNGTVTYQNDCGQHTVAFQAKVADAPLSATGVAVSGTALTSLTATVATFTDADPHGVLPYYKASIAWGDGAVSAGTITPASGGGFLVTGTHSYGAGGVYPTAVVINDVGGASATATSSATIANPPPGPPTLTPSSPTVTASTSAAFTTTVNPHGLATSVHFEYGPVLGATAAAVTYGSSTPAQAVGSDFTNHAVTATVTGLLPNVTYHWRAVASNSAGTVQGADQTLVTPADPPPPPPVLGKSVNVSPVSGVVYVKPPPGAKLSSLAPRLSLTSLASPTQAFVALSKGQGFIPLTEARQIPVGSILEATAGVARITTATATKGKLQNGDFGAGIFKLLQQRKQRGLTELNIINNRSPKKICTTLGKRAAVAARLSSKVLGRIHGSAHGRFVTKGQYSAATVRGTIWSVSNQCNGTLTKVTRDVVTVRDFRRRKTITLLSGQSYLARAPGH